MKQRDGEVLFLSLEDVVACGGGDVRRASEDVQRGFAFLLEGRVVQPTKASMKHPRPVPEPEVGFLNFMPSLVLSEGREILGCKSMGSMPANVALGLPRATGIITLFDAQTKCLRSIMDAQVISATRTGAVSMLAAQKLVPPDTQEVALIGAGVNMRTQLLGLLLALPSLRRVRVYAEGASKERFAAEMSRRTEIDIRSVATAEEAVRGCSFVVTCVSRDDRPVVLDRWIPERGVTIFSIGGFEVEASLLARMDRIVADRWADVKSRNVQTHAFAVAQGVIPESRVEDLGPILAGQRSGRTSRDESIFFSPVGLAFEDILVADRVYGEALQRGLGQRLRLWSSSEWI
ncbi:ornithine cyclodeaminase family protein [Polyangium jinanense]|uniref:Ornithine cyclodeaminase family protein n=1 Tax=Polyangium jinanense TaxID=2829994 RepID=A0A9X3XF57_9BACT|nr:ornithine cyclodeaminase family protein [Polyangium jinanense]MDC3958861.1 ornithine cyclodeaminase family protein [Polyangium jinanense]MDC3989162.1 ornithine cyclodeaminase family protein [Polyangium jinanense]